MLSVSLDRQTEILCLNGICVSTCIQTCCGSDCTPQENHHNHLRKTYNWTLFLILSWCTHWILTLFRLRCVMKNVSGEFFLRWFPSKNRLTSDLVDFVEFFHIVNYDRKWSFCLMFYINLLHQSFFVCMSWAKNQLHL